MLVNIIVMEGEDAFALPVEHFEHVGQSLPELTTELLSAHTIQSSELQAKEDLLQKLEAEMEGLQKQLQIVDREVCSTIRSICLKEGLLAELFHDCEQLEVQMAALVQEKAGMKAQVEKLLKKKKADEELRKNYEEKMETHRTERQQLEQQSRTQIELETLRGKINALKGKSNDSAPCTLHEFTPPGLGAVYHHKGMEGVLNGEKQRSLQDQVAAVMASREVLYQHNSLFKDQVRCGNFLGRLSSQSN